MATVTLKGNPIHTIGDLPPVGSKAPDFRLVGGDLKDASLETFKGKKKVLNIVPSLDTAVCATSARKFNEKAGTLPNTVVLVVSADLPFAAGRFCTAEGLKNVLPLSLMRGREPFSLHFASSVFVPSAPAANTTPRARNSRGCLSNHAPGRSVSTR